MENGILNKTRVYLSGGMEFNSEGHLWREDTGKFLKSLGIVVLDPYHKPFYSSLPEDEKTRIRLKELRRQGQFQEVHEYFKQVRADDLRMTDICDFAIVRLTIKKASIGTDEELTTLNRSKKPIFLSVDEGKKEAPLWLFGMLKPNYIYNSLDEVHQMIENINSGAKPIDSPRWKILRPEYR